VGRAAEVQEHVLARRLRGLQANWGASTTPLTRLK
jgi:hypothetical protein